MIADFFILNLLQLFPGIGKVLSVIKADYTINMFSEKNVQHPTN